MKSIGQVLFAQREIKKLTLDHVHKFIKIHPKYLAALENDDYQIFAGKVHAKGFLKIYSEFLGLNVDEIMALWRREYEKMFDKRKEEAFYQLRNVESSKLILTPALIFGVVGTILVILFFGYLFYQYKNFTGAPKLDVYYPANNTVLTNDSVDITGRSELEADVFINNQKVSLNLDGTFTATVKLKSGINTLNITAVNKLQKKAQILKTVIYNAPGGTQAKETSESTPAL